MQGIVLPTLGGNFSFPSRKLRVGSVPAGLKKNCRYATAPISSFDVSHNTSTRRLLQIVYENSEYCLGINTCPRSPKDST